jgi:HSP20 family protein
MSADEKKEIATREKEEISRDEAEPTRNGVYYSPSVDIFEDEKAITLVADIPGVSEENLDIDIKDRVLTITGRAAAPEDRLQPAYTEFGVGGYTRRFTLSDAIDQEQISAGLKDGVLTLELPKAERHRPRKIAVQVG